MSREGWILIRQLMSQNITSKHEGNKQQSCIYNILIHYFTFKLLVIGLLFIDAKVSKKAVFYFITCIKYILLCNNAREKTETPFII